MDFIKQYRGLSKQIYILSLSRAIVSMGMSFVFPFLSLLLTSAFGYSNTEAGYFTFIATLFSILGTVLGGKLADSLGRKKMYLYAALIAIVVVILAGIYAGETWGLVFIILAYADISAILPALSAMILDWSDKTNKSECFSLMYLSGNIGSALGPVIAGFLFYSHMPWIFYNMAIAFLFTFFLILFSVKDIYIPKSKSKARIENRQEGNAENAGQDRSVIAVLFRNPVLLIFILCLCLLNLCYINLDFMLPLQFTTLFGLNIGSKCSSLIWTINGIIVVTTTPVIVSFTKKLHPLFNIMIASLLHAIGFANYIFASGIAAFMLPIIIWTAGEVLVSTCAGIYIADQAPPTHKGRSMSLYEFSRGVGRLAGPVFSGQLLLVFSYEEVWFIITLICILVSLIIWLLYAHSSRPGKKRNF